MSSQPPPQLIGLVLAGGWSTRMGEDKGGIAFRGQTQTERVRALLEPHCGDVYVSVREPQARLPHYRTQRLVLDAGLVQGPAAGLLAAWNQHPDYALLTLAVDLVRVDATTVASLVSRRNAGKAATAFRHADGVIEPLCAIWEPGTAVILKQAADEASARGRSPSLRQVLERSDIELLNCSDPGRLESANTPEALAAARAGWANS